MPESDAQRAARLQLEEHVRVIGGMLRDAVKDLAGDGFGFTLLMFYMSNARRADVLATLDEFRALLREGVH